MIKYAAGFAVLMILGCNVGESLLWCCSVFMFVEICFRRILGFFVKALVQEFLDFVYMCFGLDISADNY